MTKEKLKLLEKRMRNQPVTSNMRLEQIYRKNATEIQEKERFIFAHKTELFLSSLNMTQLLMTFVSNSSQDVSCKKIFL